MRGIIMMIIIILIRRRNIYDIRMVSRDSKECSKYSYRIYKRYNSRV